MAATTSDTAGEHAIAAFVSICNVRVDVAKWYLESTGGALDSAVDLYFDHRQGLERAHFAPEARVNDDNWVLNELMMMATDQFSPEIATQPVSKRGVYKCLAKFEVGKSHLEAKEEVKNSQNKDKVAEPPAGAEIAVANTGAKIQTAKQTETILVENEENLSENIKSSRKELLASGDETGSEKKGICPTADKIDLCTICLCNFEVGDMASKLPCGHIFHCKCIMQWLQKGRNTCPLCRHKLACNPADDESDSEDDQNPLPPHGAHHSPYHPATRALLIESHSYFSTISDDRNNYTYPEERYPQPDRADAASADEMPPRSSVMRRTPGAGRPQSTRYRTYRTYSGQYYNQRGRQMPSPAGADADQTRPTWGQWPPYYPRPTCEEPCWRGPPVPCYPSVPHPYDAYFESQQPYHYPYYPHPQQQLHTAPRNHANGRPHPEHFPQRRPDAFCHPSAREEPRYAPPSGAAPPAVSEQTSTPAPSSGSEGPRDAHQVPAATACPVGEGNRTRPPLAYHGQQLGAAAVSPQLPPHPMMVPMGVPYPAPHIYAVPLEYYNCM